MKLLLTSGGIRNQKIADAVLELVGKPAKEISLAFIPTAANIDITSKEWLINDLNNIKNQGYKFIDIVDISALPKWNWQPRLEKADVLFFCGGVTPHLMRWIEESGLKELLPELLKTKVWVGISAGSIILCPTLVLSSKEKKISYKKDFDYESEKGLGFVNFYFRPHMNAPYFPQYKKELLAESMKEFAKSVSEEVYVLDDEMAVKVVDGKVEVVGEGEYIVFNQ